MKIALKWLWVLISVITLGVIAPISFSSIRRGPHGTAMIAIDSIPNPAPSPGADNTTLESSQTFGQRLTAVETAPTFAASLNYTMALGETHGFLMKINTDTNGIDLNCSGSAVSSGDITCTFYKMWAFYPDNSDKWNRASLSTSPATGSDAYYDAVVAIPSGAGNFTPEATSTPEYIWLDIAVASGATPSSDASFTINAGSDSINPTFEIVNVTMPTVPTMQFLAELSESSIDDGAYGDYSSTSGDQRKVDLLKNYTDVLKSHRITAYKNILGYLDIDTAPTPDDLDIDEYSGILGDASFRTNVADIFSDAGWFMMWMSSPQLNTSDRASAYADAAQQTISAESELTANKMVVYAWDEPGVGDCATVKTVLDNWDGKNTKILLTANSAYDDTTCSASIDFSTYSDLVLTPVVNHVEISGGTTAASTYTNMGLYSSCQGNCGTELNSDSTGGSDQGYVDAAYVDLPSVRARAFFTLTMNSTYRSKMQWLLHYASVQAHGSFNGVKITPVADSSGSLDGTYFILDGQQGSVCFWYDIDNSGTTVPGGCSGADNSQEISTVSTDAAATAVTSATVAVIDARSEFTAYSNTTTTINVMGDTWDSAQSAGTSGFTVAWDQGTSTWQSVRRFQVMGDGTLLYPMPASFKPFVGLSAFTKGNDTATPSLRMKVIRDSSFERDMYSLYYTAQTSTAPADALVTDTNDFDAVWADYEYMRWRTLQALANSDTIASHTLPGTHLAFLQQPSTSAVDASISPAITVQILNRFGVVDTSDSSSSCALTKATGTGSLTVTSPATASSGICTFSDASLDTAGDFTLAVAVSGMTGATSDSVTITEGGGAGSDLNDITALAHWWRGDDVTQSGTITNWNNIKTSATDDLVTTGTNHTAPDYSATGGPASQPIGTFTAANKDMSHDVTFSGGSVSTTAAYIFVVYAPTSCASEGGIIGSMDRTNDWSVKYTTGAIASIDVAENGIGTFRAASTGCDTNWHWVIARVPNGSGNTKIWVDGSLEVNSALEGAAQVTNMRIGALMTGDTIGNGAADSILYGNVSIAEAAVFDESFNETTDLATLVTYVNDQYGL